MSAVKPIPDGYHSVTPYLTFKSADAAIQFYKRAFGAKELSQLSTPECGIAHAEVQIGNSRLMMADEFPAFGNKSPETLGGSPVSMMFYVDDVDAAFSHALKEGATERRPVADQFYGDRTGTLVDPFGYQWSLGTHKEDVSEEEMQARMEKMYATQ
ncbi:MAG: VOC family protein [Acidobacteriota bacterium]|nr:VOC family protein [Acidobacteriota bacterium]